MQNQLKAILETAKEKISAAPSLVVLEGLRVEYLGKKEWSLQKQKLQEIKKYFIKKSVKCKICE